MENQQLRRLGHEEPGGPAMQHGCFRPGGREVGLVRDMQAENCPVERAGGDEEERDHGRWGQT